MKDQVYLISIHFALLFSYLFLLPIMALHRFNDYTDGLGLTNLNVFRGLHLTQLEWETLLWCLSSHVMLSFSSDA